MEKFLKNNIKISWRQIFWGLFYVFIFAICLSNTSSYLDPDFGWHLKTGQEIIAEKSVPHINKVNYTLEGQRWVDHEWLSEVFLYKNYEYFGYQGIEIIFSLLIVLIFFILNYFIGKANGANKNNLYLLAPIEIFGLIAAMPSFGVRLQEIGLLFFLLLLLIIYRYEQTKNYKVLWFLLPLLYLWSNLHGTFLIAFFIFGLFAGAKILEIILHKKWPNKFVEQKNVFSIKQILIFIGIATLSIITTLLTPYGLELYSFLIGYGNSYYLTAISEWLPQWFFPFSYPQLLFISFTLATIILSFYYSFKNWKNLKIFEILLIIALAIMALKSRRHTQLLVIAALPFIFNFIKNFLEITIPEKNNSKKSSITDKISQSFIIIVLIISIGSKIITTNHVKNPFTQFCGDYACAGINFLKNNPQYDNANIYNAYAWGGFMIWTYPERKIFIDGRMPQMEYEQYTILQEYKSFYKEDEIAAKIIKHNIGLFFLENKKENIKLSWIEKNFFMINEDRVNSQKDELREYLNASPDWEIVYQDEVSIIYAKK